jgi:hypothetical protein
MKERRKERKKERKKEPLSDNRMSTDLDLNLEPTGYEASPAVTQFLSPSSQCMFF